MTRNEWKTRFSKWALDDKISAAYENEYDTRALTYTLPKNSIEFEQAHNTWTKAKAELDRLTLERLQMNERYRVFHH